MIEKHGGTYWAIVLVGIIFGFIGIVIYESWNLFIGQIEDSVTIEAKNINYPHNIQYSVYYHNRRL